MLFTVAQAKPTVFESVLAIFSRLDTLAHPEMLVETLQAMSAVWAVIFLAVLLSGIALRIAEQPNPVNGGILILAGIIFVTKVWQRRGE